MCKCVLNQEATAHSNSDLQAMFTLGDRSVNKSPSHPSKSQVSFLQAGESLALARCGRSAPGGL